MRKKKHEKLKFLTRDFVYTKRIEATARWACHIIAFVWTLRVCVGVVRAPNQMKYWLLKKWVRLPQNDSIGRCNVLLLLFFFSVVSLSSNSVFVLQIGGKNARCVFCVCFLLFCC